MQSLVSSMARKKKSDSDLSLEDIGAISLSDLDNSSRIKTWVSTGSIVVDSVLAGGRQLPCTLIPFGRQVEISGKPGAGKTTLCAQIAARTQAAGGKVIVVDTEERIDHPYWEKLGVDTSSVISLHADSLEEVFNKQEKAIKIMSSKYPDIPLLMLWDSVGGTSSQEVLEGDGDLMERAKKMYGREAKLIGTGVKALNGLITKSNVCYIYTNHLYTDMNVTYGAKEKEYGGLKLQHYATVRLRLTKTANISAEDKFGNTMIVGQKVKVKANKNSMAPIQMEKEAVIIGGEGFSNDYTVFDLGRKAGLVSGSGAWSSVTLGGEEIKFQGWAGFKEKVATHTNYNELVQSMLESL